MKAILVMLAALVPLGAAEATNWKNSTMEPGVSVTERGRAVCLTGENCWCYSKRKVVTPGAACSCGSGAGVLKYEGQLRGGTAYCQ